MQYIKNVIIILCVTWKPLKKYSKRNASIAGTGLSVTKIFNYVYNIWEIHGFNLIRQRASFLLKWEFCTRVDLCVKNLANLIKRYLYCSFIFL